MGRIDDTVEEIRRMETHSSSVVAVKAARALRELVEREFTSLDEYESALERNSGALRRANPSHASLFTTQREVVDAVVGQSDDLAEARRLTEAAVERVVDRVDNGKRRAAASAAETFDDGEVVLTHDYSSTLLAAMERAVPERELTVYVTEARPRYLGRKLARRLAETAGVEVHLGVDGASGYLLEQTDIDRAMVGMDCIVRGTLYNRVGTFPLAAAAAEAGVPLDVVGSSAKVIEEGFVFENEFRPPAEVSLEPLEEVVVENPAYDATPAHLVDTVITGEQRFSPSD
ncbi:MAG: translation initiation factor 2B subunit II family (IF-2BII) [uncultured archaeon A07HB70]|nr:MAG: translation initiation factor 2B subunit II family (IF-2BII) [uncultured archaeon A07HB70]